MKRDEEIKIVYRQWNASSPKAVFLLVHGLGGHSSRWGFLADFFLKNNISSYAISLKGFGETKDPKGHVSSFDIYYEDIHMLYNIAYKENPGKDFFLIGESMGGLIAFLIAARKPDLFKGLVCIAPAFKSILKFPPLNYAKMLLALFYNPKKQFSITFNSEMCTRDVDYCKHMESDDKEHRLASAKLLFNVLTAQIKSQFLKNRVKIPVLFLLSGRDILVDSHAAKKVFETLKTENKTIIEYPDMYHALSIDLGREKVFEDILRWLQSLPETREQ